MHYGVPGDAAGYAGDPVRDPVEVVSPGGGCAPPLGEEAALGLVRLFDVLADATRLRILSLLVRYDGRMCVSEIAASFPMLRQPTISHHLQVLFDAGLVKRRKSGSSVYYSADRETLSSVSGAIDALLASGVEGT